MKLICKKHKNKMKLIDEKRFIYKCPKCDAAIRYYEDEDEYMYYDNIEDLYELCNDDDDDYYICRSTYDDMPECCAACGGDYPNCVDSCPIYD